MFNFGTKKRIYMDYAAATPVRPEIVSLMQPFLSDDFANPGAIHQEGVQAKAAVEDARLEVARTLEVRPEAVYFTASGTESNNLAIAGVIEARRQEGEEYADMEVLTTAIEHPSVIEVLNHYASLGVKVTEVSVGEDGVLDLNDLKNKLSHKTVLITTAFVNSEIGSIAPVRPIVRAVAAYNKEEGAKIVVHLDAAQAPLWLSCSVSQLGVDIMSLDAGKCYGPKGVGVLALRRGVELVPTFFGGGQERGLRPGTENVPLIVGAARAIKLAQDSYKERAEKVSALRDQAIEKLTKIEEVEVNGSAAERVANNVNVSIAGVEAEFAAITLDTAGIACSTKSACGSGRGTGSAVVRAITGDDERARTSLRFSFGEGTTAAEIDTLVSILTEHITKTRAFNESTPH
jgi:cysteine desulfurase